MAIKVREVPLGEMPDADLADHFGRVDALAKDADDARAVVRQEVMRRGGELVGSVYRTEVTEIVRTSLDSARVAEYLGAAVFRFQKTTRQAKVVAKLIRRSVA